jgi:hypothetical protein
MLMFRMLISMLLIATMFTLTGCVSSAPQVQTGVSVEMKSEDVRIVDSFDEEDRRKIKEYYRGKDTPKKIPPGLAKKHELPPGLQKHVARYSVLPPGLQDENLPLELEKTLSPLPRGYVRLKLGGNVVLMDEKTRIAVDVIWDAAI